MFTGLIQEIGVIKRKTRLRDYIQVVVEAPKTSHQLKIGDSICVDGICLTVRAINNSQFVVEVVAETIGKTLFNDYKVGDRVNLEVALTAESHLGGHIVQGHIDEVGKITSIKPLPNRIDIEIEASKKLFKYIVEKGSIAIDGISLTIASIRNSKIRISIIPHTYKTTTLLNKKMGQKVNIEVDILGKYVNNSLSRNNKIDSDYLNKLGFSDIYQRSAV